MSGYRYDDIALVLAEIARLKLTGLGWRVAHHGEETTS